MKIITNGDFIFPLNFITYLKEQLYIWSYTNGTPNLDESIRFLIHLPNLLVFSIFGSNIAVSYFYLAFVAAVCFASFYYFARQFLNVERRSICLVLSLLYTINPIFLGNYSKLGLVLAASMLPLLLVWMKRFYASGHFMYLFLVIIALNISFIHPFNLAVNTLVVGGYAFYLCASDREFLKRSVPKFIMAGGAFLLINAYIITAVLGVGSVSKSTLSQNITDEALSSANLVNVANTGGLFTSLSLSKNIFLDFNFYNQGAYRIIYFFSVYLLLALLIAILIYTKRKLAHEERLRILLLLTLFLMLVLLSTGTIWGVDKLLAFFSGAPGGWAFRSPLKWQLYIPLVLAASFGLLIARLGTRYRRAALAGLMVIILLLNGYLVASIQNRLLKPKNINQLSALSQDIKPQEKALLVQDELCAAYFRTDISPLNSLRATYAAKSAQLKEVESETLYRVNISNYDRVLSCSELPSLSDYTFESSATHRLSKISLHSYKNPHPKNLVYTTKPVLLPSKLNHVSEKYKFLQKLHGGNIDFVEPKENITASTAIEDVFESINSGDIADGKIKRIISLPHDNSQKNWLEPGRSDIKIFYLPNEAEKVLRLSTSPLPGFQSFDKPLDVTSYGDSLTVYFESPLYDFSNLVKNPSLEDGTWSETVGDCFKYDDDPQLAMGRSESEKTDGKYSLELEAERHLACTGPQSIAANEHGTYLMTFDYQTSGEVPARYNVSFGNEDLASMTETLEKTHGAWQTYQKIIQPPPFSLALDLTLYGIPGVGTKAITRYDNFHITKIPDVVGLLYTYQELSSGESAVPATVDYNYVNPTKISISAKNAKGPINIVLNDSYHKGWSLLSKNQGSSYLKPQKLPTTHYKINNQENAWLVDIDAICSQPKACSQNADGTYNLQASIEYTPQRLYNIGLAISCLAIIGYTVYAWRSRRYKRYSLRSR